MPKITISYRRADAPSDAGRIFDRLAARYGQESVFMDIDTIPFGVDFRDYVDGALRGTDIVLAVIGPRWVGRRGARARIREETDPVRIEIAAAMRMGKIIVPVLVANAVMPEPSDLPESIAKLAFLNAAEIDPGKDFHANLDRLIRFIDALPVAAPAAVTSGEEAEHNSSSTTAPVRVEPVIEPSPRVEPAVKPPIRMEPAAERPARIEFAREAPVRPELSVEPPAKTDVSEYARRISGAWRLSVIRGIALLVYSVVFLPVPSTGFWLAGFSIYSVVELTALIAMARTVRGQSTGAAWFLAEAAFFLGLSLANWNFRAFYQWAGPSGAPVFFTGCLVLRAFAELTAGVALARHVRSERWRVAAGVLLVMTQGTVVANHVTHGFAVTPAYIAGNVLAATAFLVLAWRLRRENLAAATATAAAAA